MWGLECRVAVTDGRSLEQAGRIVRSVLSDVGSACNRFDPDSELRRLQASLSSGARVSATLALLISRALDTAAATGGDVDPTLGVDLEGLGYDRDFTQILARQEPSLPETPALASGREPRRRPPAGWERISLVDRVLTVPQGLRLDLGATAKAVAADQAAQQVAGMLGCGVFVSVGGDIATAGGSPDGGWQVLVQDLPQDPWQQVTLPDGHALATSSTQKRRWRHAGRHVHHILDPRFGIPATPVWRSVTVAAETCLRANSFSTAAIVRGFRAPGWFRENQVAGRFVDQQGRVITTCGWPGQMPGRAAVQAPVRPPSDALAGQRDG